VRGEGRGVRGEGRGAGGGGGGAGWGGGGGGVGGGVLGGGGGGGGVRCFVGVNLSSSQPLYLFGMRLSSFIECGGG